MVTGETGLMFLIVPMSSTTTRIAVRRQVATTGVVGYRGTAMPQLAKLVLFGDNPSGEVFYFNADRLPGRTGRDSPHPLQQQWLDEDADAVDQGKRTRRPRAQIWPLARVPTIGCSC